MWNAHPMFAWDLLHCQDTHSHNTCKTHCCTEAACLEGSGAPYKAVWLSGRCLDLLRCAGSHRSVPSVPSIWPAPGVFVAVSVTSGWLLARSLLLCTGSLSQKSRAKLKTAWLADCCLTVLLPPACRRLYSAVIAAMYRVQGGVLMALACSQQSMGWPKTLACEDVIVVLQPNPALCAVQEAV